MPIGAQSSVKACCTWHGVGMRSSIAVVMPRFAIRPAGRLARYTTFEVSACSANEGEHDAPE